MLPENCIYKQQFAFIPHRLDIVGRPELNDFPYNILFVSYRRTNGTDLSGTALYEPEIKSYRIEEDARLLDYRKFRRLIILGRYVV